MCSFLDVFLGHPLCKIPPRLHLGTASVLLDSLMMLWRGESEECEKSKKVKKVKKWEKLKELHSRVHSVTLIQNVHNFKQLDTSGYKWIQVDTSGHQWKPIDTSGHKWTVVDTGGQKWAQVDTT